MLSYKILKERYEKLKEENNKLLNENNKLKKEIKKNDRILMMQNEYLTKEIIRLKELIEVNR